MSPRSQTAIVTAAFIVLAVAATWPVASDPAQLALAGEFDNDYKFNLWVIFWGAHALLTDPLDLHHGNMFHPERYTFAYSDIELSHSLLMLPVIVATGNPTLVANLLLIAALVIGGVGFYRFGLRLTGLPAAAAAGSLLFVFNPAHFSRYLRPQFIGDHWMPWLAWALLGWIGVALATDTSAVGVGLGPTGACPGVSPGQNGSGIRSDTRRGVVWATAVVVFFCLHALTGAHNAVFGAVLTAAMVLYYGIAARAWRTPAFRTGLLAIGVAIAVILGPLFWPYFLLEETMAAERVSGPEVLVAGSAGAQELLTGGSRLHGFLDERFGWPSALFARPLRSHLFPGIVALVLAGVGLLRFRSRGDGGSAVGSADSARTASTAGKPLAWGLDVLLLATATYAVALAMSGGARIWLAFVPVVAPPAWGFVVVAAATLAARLHLRPEVPHVLAAAGHALASRLRTEADLRLWALLAGGCLWLSLGPAGGLYTLLAQLPGLGLIRVPSRFMILGVFALSALGTFGAAALWRRGRAGRMALLALALPFVVEATFAPLPSRSVPAGPSEVDRWLAGQPGTFAVVEVPIESSNPTIAARQLYSSIHHWKKLLVGYSGFRSRENVALLERLERTFPGDTALDEMAALDVRYLLVRADRLDAEALAAIEAQARLREARRFGELRVYELAES